MVITGGGAGGGGGVEPGFGQQTSGWERQQQAVCCFRFLKTAQCCVLTGLERSSEVLVLVLVLVLVPVLC